MVASRNLPGYDGPEENLGEDRMKAQSRTEAKGHVDVGEGLSKYRAALLSIGSNSTLLGLKVAVGLLTGSVSILSEATHSAMDLLASVIAAVAVRRASRPADRGHLFGHGKFENLSGALEALLILGAAVFISWEAIGRLVRGGELEYLEAGLGVMVLSVVVNTLVSRRLFGVASQTESIALEADALHLRADVWTSAGVLGSLGIIYVSDLLITDPQANIRFHTLDPVVALLVAVFIVRAAWELLGRSLEGLLDRPLPAEEDRIIREILGSQEEEFLEFHELRHRRSGPERHIDLHLVVSPQATVGQVHALCDKIEALIQARLPRAKVLIHTEPCKRVECPKCRAREACSAKEK